MVEVTKIPEKKAPLKRSWKTTVTSKAQPALSGKVPDGPVAAPARPDNARTSVYGEMHDSGPMGKTTQTMASL